MTNNIEIKHLFRTRRLPDNDLKFICLLLYIPIGLVLFILRTILGFIVILIGCSLSDTPIIHKLINKIACLTLGITVTVENPEKRENVEIFISNHVSIFDHLAIHTATGSVSPGNGEMHPLLARGLGLYNFGNPTINLDVFKRNIKQVINEQKMPVHFTPEEKITNGGALIKFKTLPFTFTTKVQPVCINIDRPFFDISITTLAANYWIDFFYFMFTPLTNYKLKYLPCMEKKSLNDEEFAEIVRQSLATALRVEAVDFTAADLNEWEKRQMIEQRQQSQQQQQEQQQQTRLNVDGEIRSMANMVKEVLPHVPLNTIYKDLIRTRNVDTTITNILEGRVRFVPERPPQTDVPKATTSINQQQSSSSSAPSTSNTNVTTSDIFNTAATKFGKNAVERNLSFQERKERLIANARRRYIEKHNLDVLI